MQYVVVDCDLVMWILDGDVGIVVDGNGVFVWIKVIYFGWVGGGQGYEVVEIDVVFVYVFGEQDGYVCFQIWCVIWNVVEWYFLVVWFFVLWIFIVERCVV